ncbi:MAG: hypothetical protein IPK19_17730 [Chloroflexi bacterium]|nr:hypothetical protein [Chloroflexota bacterium]
MENANLIDGADTITFDPAFFSIARTIAPPGTLNIYGNLTIDGPGSDLATMSGGGLFRVFMVEAGIDVAIQEVTISGGNACYEEGDGWCDEGGGIYNAGTLRVANSTISGNSAETGGGIFNYHGTLTVANSTFSGNSAEFGGGIFNDYGTLTVTNSTISGNSAEYGGGIYNHHGALTIVNSTFSGNPGGSSGGLYALGSGIVIENSILANTTCAGGSGGSFSGTFNVATPGSGCPGATEYADLLLGPLVDNGGSTQTIVLLPGSPAIDAGNNALLPADTTDMDDDGNTSEPIPFDQRGANYPRVRGLSVDVGAYEYEPTTVIRGVIYQPDGLSPLTAQVRLLRITTPPAPNDPGAIDPDAMEIAYQVMSDADGEFVFPAVAAGDYIIEVVSGEHGTWYFDGAATIEEAAILGVEPGQTLEQMDVVMQGGPVKATFSGAVTMQGRGVPPNALYTRMLSVVMTPVGGGAPVFQGTVISDVNGAFAVNLLTPGSYRVWVKADHTLAVAQTVALAAGDNSIVMGLREGDANGDNVVNIVDFSILAASFGRASEQTGYDERADFHEDNLINIQDFSLLASNFGQSGASQMP